MRETPLLSVGESVSPTVGTRKLNNDPFIVTDKNSTDYTVDLLTEDGVVSKTIPASSVEVETSEDEEMNEEIIHITSTDIAGVYISKGERPIVSDIKTVADSSTGNTVTYILPQTNDETKIPLVSLDGSVMVQVPTHTIQRRILLDEAQEKSPEQVISDQHDLHYDDGVYKTMHGVSFDDPMDCLVFHSGVSVGSKIQY